ncbi:MAG: diguanylate cyclase [Kangiella sp.]|jgi:diguanylate cyclase (GGDEF)-like protein|nr:diguanylate cyclase [Kangiella sp.]
MRNFSLRTLLTVPFLLLFIGAVGTISWISYHNAQQGTERAARLFGAELGARIESHLEQFFATPATLVQLNRQHVLRERPDLGDVRVLAPMLYDQIQQLPYLTFMTVAFADGRYIGSTRPPGGEEGAHLICNIDGEPLTIAHFSADKQGLCDRRISEAESYDPRVRPFMTPASKHQQPYWYPVYRHSTYNSLGTGIAAPIRDSAGKLIGLASVDLALEHIGKYLQSLPVGDGGLAFVIEPNGSMIASSTKTPIYDHDSEQLELITIEAHPDPLLRTVGKKLHEVKENRQATVEFEGERYLFDLRRLSNEYGLELVVGVVLPERAFTAPLVDGARKTSIFTLLAVIVGAVIGLMLARRIAAPVERISRRADRLALGELEQQLEHNSPIREVNQLGLSFSRMAGELRRLINNLEARVAERTEALQRANAELEGLSMLDGLTGIANRRRFDEVLESEWQRGRREQTPLALVICDIDYFKEFNDHFGHQCGDEALKAVARTLEASLHRPADLAARYGGEEFALILPNTDRDGAFRVAEAAREAIRQLNIQRDDLDGYDRVTISLGLAIAIPDGEHEPDELINAADRQLYRAKEAGRDCTMAQLKE